MSDTDAGKSIMRTVENLSKGSRHDRPTPLGYCPLLNLPNLCFQQWFILSVYQLGLSLNVINEKGFRLRMRKW